MDHDMPVLIPRNCNVYKKHASELSSKNTYRNLWNLLIHPCAQWVKLNEMTLGLYKFNRGRNCSTNNLSLFSIKEYKCSISALCFKFYCVLYRYDNTRSSLVFINTKGNKVVSLHKSKNHTVHDQRSQRQIAIWSYLFIIYDQYVKSTET